MSLASRPVPRCATLGLFASLVACGPGIEDDTLLAIHHAPERFARRAGDFTANICGSVSPEAGRLRYRINAGEWLKFENAEPRIPAPLFTLELAASDLIPGRNLVSIVAGAASREVEFDYAPGAVELPIHVDWSTVAELDVQDGYWETLERDGRGWVRPKPGHEGYDRVLAVTGAFPGARRIEAEFVFRDRTRDGKPYGFGVLPMWGGRPDEPGVRPRRGWSFSLVWFYSHYGGVGMEFSHKFGGEPPDWVSSYRDLKLRAGQRNRVVVESWPERTAGGAHLRYRQRMKWWVDGEPEPEVWMELLDTEGSPLSPGEYAVALLAHRSQVEFGPISILPLDRSTTE